VKFFFDNNLAPKIAKGLNGFVFPDHQVIHLKERFPATTDDVQWMRELAQVVNLLCESMGVRAIQRFTGLHQETILNILETAGQKAAAFMDAKIRNLQAKHVQTDEIASYVGCHQYKAKDDEQRGGFFTFLSIDQDSKLIINMRTDRRNLEVATEFMSDLKSRMASRFQLSTDGWRGYSGPTSSVKTVFGNAIDYATEIKHYVSKNRAAAKTMFQLERYGALRVDSVAKKARIGQPDMDMATTSHCERTNLTIRQFIKRFNRLTIGYSKKLDNHKHALALFMWYFNFAKKHGAHGKTPAEVAGLTDKPMTIGELINSRNPISS
jgi:IS1 family transposase